MVKQDIISKARKNARVISAALGGAIPIFITDQARVPTPEAVVEGLPEGAVVICRDYDHPERAGLARRLRQITKTNGHLLLVAGDAALAREVGADGVHLPEYQVLQPAMPKGFGFVSAACHSRQALWRAQRLGVDLALVSPVFGTRSHPNSQPLEIHRFSRLIIDTGLPVAALGGVNIKTAKKLRPLKLAAFAAIDGFCR